MKQLYKYNKLVDAYVRAHGRPVGVPKGPVRQVLNLTTEDVERLKINGTKMIKQTLRASAVVVIFFLAAPAAFASSLSYNAAHNQDLTAGHYDFKKYHSPLKASGKFYDKWGFSLQHDAKVSLGIKDIEFGWHRFKLLDISNMKIVFDGKNLSEGTWYHQMLQGGKQYEFALAGQTAGLFGGKYKGLLSVSNGVSPVPVPASVWLFLSALAGLFVIRRRQQPQHTAA